MEIKGRRAWPRGGPDACSFGRPAAISALSCAISRPRKKFSVVRMAAMAASRPISVRLGAAPCKRCGGGAVGRLCGEGPSRARRRRAPSPGGGVARQGEQGGGGGSAQRRLSGPGAGGGVPRGFGWSAWQRPTISWPPWSPFVQASKAPAGTRPWTRLTGLRVRAVPRRNACSCEDRPSVRRCPGGCVCTTRRSRSRRLTGHGGAQSVRSRQCARSPCTSAMLG